MLVEILCVVMILVSIAIVALVLVQEGKSAGLGTITGAASETYWSKNKGRSKEGKLENATRILAIVFFVLAIVLISKWI